MANPIVLANMGGARTKGELKLFLKNMFRDPRIVKGPHRHLLSRLIPLFRAGPVWEQYRQIGGSSLHRLTQQLAEALHRLSGRPVEIGMRYTPPFLDRVVQGLERFTLLPLYPHYSTTTYQSILDLLHSLYPDRWEGRVVVVPPFYNHPDYLSLIEELLWERVSREEAPEFRLLCSAHGLPKGLVERERDPYPQQVEEQVELLRERVGGYFKSVELVYQSRFGFQEWLQPYLNRRLQQLKGERVVVLPLSFFVDNSETELELGVEYRQLAAEVGVVDYRVVPAPNHRGAQLLWRLVQQAEERERVEKEERLSRWREGDPYREQQKGGGNGV